jgi:hypothetical protein
MTTKRTTQKGTRDKESPIRDDMLVVSPDEAEQLVHLIRDGHLYEDDDAIGAFLLLINSVVYCEPSDRENYLRAAERVLMTYTMPFQEGAERLRKLAYESVSGVTLK